MVWEVEPGFINRYLNYDQKYHVTVRDVVVKEDTLTFDYTVIVSTIQHPPACQEDLVWSETQCDCINEQTTAVLDRSNGSGTIILSPNPATDLLQLTLPKAWDGMPTSVLILDYTGRLVTQKIVDRSPASFITCDYPAGLYIAAIQHQSSVQYEKFVIKH
ncbi:MAG: T9SS type A sorting domain-containing protein [Saprospiraceae bacterium]|nr:T9SS type A sorting domain-containing protein [Saprospiraceae bacterium]